MNDTENTLQDEKIYSLILLEDFKSILNLDDRDDKLSRFCLVASTHTIEQYCKRRLCLKTIHEIFWGWQDITLFLREFPVREVIQISNENLEIRKSELIEPHFYSVLPDCGTDLDVPFEIHFSPVIEQKFNVEIIKVVYSYGYSGDDVPADLKAACLELAVWNFNRYKSRKIGIINNEKLTSNNGNSFEMSMPENVKSLLEPYRRKTI